MEFALCLYVFPFSPVSLLGELPADQTVPAVTAGEENLKGCRESRKRTLAPSLRPTRSQRWEAVDATQPCVAIHHMKYFFSSSLLAPENNKTVVCVEETEEEVEEEDDGGMECI